MEPYIFINLLIKRRRVDINKYNFNVVLTKSLTIKNNQTKINTYILFTITQCSKS